MGAALFFIIQVALRVNVYFEYNTNVDVEKVYTTKVPFPAVTICNQNNFRFVTLYVMKFTFLIQLAKEDNQYTKEKDCWD